MRGPLALAASLLAFGGHAAEETVAVSFSVGEDGRARIEVPSSNDVYHVLYYRPDAEGDAEYAAAIHMGADGAP